ncbi:hypothetical protein N9W34_01670 [Rickettsiales bacterium]|nr:hypothetical protein [Rickettsiales bacterium]
MTSAREIIGNTGVRELLENTGAREFLESSPMAGFLASEGIILFSEFLIREGYLPSVENVVGKTASALTNVISLIDSMTSP